MKTDTPKIYVEFESHEYVVSTYILSYATCMLRICVKYQSLMCWPSMSYNDEMIFLYNVCVSLCMLGDFACFFPSDIYPKLSVLKKNTRVSNSLNLDQDQRIVGYDLCPNCLQKLSAGGTSRKIVNHSRET